MALDRGTIATARTFWALDLLIVVWTAVWIALGFAVRDDVRTLRELSSTVVTAGAAVRSSGHALDQLGSVPFVGGSLRDVAREAERAGTSAIVSGRHTRASVGSLADRLGLVVALVPTLPLLLLYLPMRLRWLRERWALAAALRRGGGLEPAVVDYLAHRALDNLSFRQLQAVSADPWRDLENGRRAALANAELRRLGFRLRVESGAEPR